MQATDGSRHKQSGRQGETVRTAVRTVATVRNPSTAGGTSRTKSNSTAPAKVEELIELVNHWRDVKRNLSPQMKYCLQRATLSVNEEGTALRVLFPKEMNVESGYFLEEPERIEQLKQELSRQSGRDVELEVSVMNTDNDDSDMINLDCIHMDVKIED